MGGHLPSGTVTFLFTDVEGSTRLLGELGPHPYAQALTEHRRVVRDALSRNGGVEVDTQGDAFFCAFGDPREALQAAAEAQRALAEGPLRVRMGLHTGTPHLTEDGYVGADVHLAARIAAAGHGGQVLLSAITAALVGAGGVTDLGEHRLKDFPDPVGIFQAGTERFPPLRTISNTNLPRPASSLVGRERELAEVVSLIREGARLLTLTGPGGSGKTRLGIEAAAEVVPEFRAGVFWVGLAPLRDPALVTTTIAQTLGAKDGLADHIGDRELLLLLDNLEQVVEAAPELAELVEACPNLRLVVTSRELLRVRGEAEYPVPPLADPEAVRLFSARSGAEPDQAVEALCRALDNLPLAIELAAARAPVLSPAQILERLSGRLDLLRGGRDADPRQQTLRATIAWSHDLLSPEEQALFARLAVFRGGCTLEAAEEVVEADLDTLQSLVQKSLLRHREDRFFMLETVREYASEQLEASGELEAWWRRHARWFLELAEEAEPNLRGNPKEWLDRLEAEHDNLRAALDRLTELGETQEVLELAGALWRFWEIRGHWREGRQRLEEALAADAPSTPARGKALNAATALADELGDLEAAEAWGREALGLHRSLGDEWGIAMSRYLLGGIAASRRDWAGAREIFEDCAEAFRRLGDDHHTLVAVRALAWMHEELGDVEGYRALRREHLRLARETGNQRAVALGLRFLADLAREEGRFQDALSLVGEAYAVHCDLGELFHVVNDLGQLAEILVSAGRPRVATSLLARAEMLREERDVPVESWVVEMNARSLVIIRTGLDGDAFARAWEEGRVLTTDEVVALALESLGENE